MSKKEVVIRSFLFAFANLVLTRFLGGLQDSNLLVTVVYLVFVAALFTVSMTLFTGGKQK